jgi:phosphatidylserine decarboxylase
MNNHGIILQQGYKRVLIAAIIAIFFLVVGCDFMSWVTVFITLFMLFIYRNPNRHIYMNGNKILSPVDGKIEAIDYIDDKVKIYCKVDLLGVHNVKAPIAGKLSIDKFQHGLNLNPNSYKANKLNEQIEFIISDDQRSIGLSLISGICNNSLDYLEKSNVEQGDNISLMVDGNAILSIKNNGNLDIKIGDKIVAGQTSIITFN